MNQSRAVFSHLCAHLPASSFRRWVARYQADRYVKSFSCWDQCLCLIFAQLTQRESLRDIGACLRSLPGRLYHLGIHGSVARSTLADANEVRDWRTYADFAQVLIGGICVFAAATRAPWIEAPDYALTRPSCLLASTAPEDTPVCCAGFTSSIQNVRRNSYFSRTTSNRPH